MLGEADVAIQRFKRYLELRPDAPDRAEVEERLARLQKRVEAQRARTAVQQPALEPAPVVRDQPVKKRSRVGLWVGIGVGAAVVVGAAITLGVVFGTRTSNQANDFWAQGQRSCDMPCLVLDLR